MQSKEPDESDDEFWDCEEYLLPEEPMELKEPAASSSKWVDDPYQAGQYMSVLKFQLALKGESFFT